MNTSLTLPAYSIGVESATPVPFRDRIHIIISNNSIGIALFDPIENLIKAFKKYIFETAIDTSTIHDLFVSDSWFATHYQSYHLHTQYRECMLLPISETVDNNLIREAIPVLQANLYSNADFMILNEFIKKSDYKIHIGTEAILNQLLQRQILFNKNTLYINICDGFFEQYAFHGSALQLYNTYEFDAAEDIAYFVMSIYELLKWNTHTVPLYVIGQLTKPSRIYDILYTYIKEIHFIDKQPQINYTKEFQEIENQIIYPIACMVKL